MGLGLNRAREILLEQDQGAQVRPLLRPVVLLEVFNVYAESNCPYGFPIRRVDDRSADL